MHVGLNLIYLVPGETGGMETYGRELITALARRPDLRLTAFINEEAAADDGPWSDLVASVVVPVAARNRREWVRGEQQLLPRLARRAGVDLVHSLASTAPAWGRFRRVVTIHDLIYRHHPETHFGLLSRGMRVLVPLAARRSDRVIAVSTATRDDVVRMLGVPASKVDVVPNGVGREREASPLDEREIRSRFELGARPVVLSVSAKRPHKNLARLLEALSLIAPERRPVLVLPGYTTPHEAELRRVASERGVADDVRFLDWIPAAELEGLYAAAGAFVFPSLYEGFGLPVLEAMARGVPVACSAAPSLAEAAGDAALLFDPRDARAMAAAIERLLTDPDQAERLRRAGQAHAARFTWERTARETAASYARALGRDAGQATT
jgi:glycosyltransferase involved in cell wall biosynthesis